MNFKQAVIFGAGFALGVFAAEMALGMLRKATK